MTHKISEQFAAQLCPTKGLPFGFICAADNLYFIQTYHMPPGNGLPNKYVVVTA